MVVSLRRLSVVSAFALALGLSSCLPPPAPEQPKAAAPKDRDVDFGRYIQVVKLMHLRCLHMLQSYHQQGGRLVITTSSKLHADGSVAEVSTGRSDHGPISDEDVACIAKGVKSGIQFASPQPEGREVSWAVIYR
jgi:hypothetical protein